MMRFGRERNIRITIAALFLMIASVLTGCYFRAEDVPLFTEQEATVYVQHNYGDVEDTVTVKERSEDEIIYEFTDKEYGFLYTLRSYKSEIGMDGSVFGYHPAKASTFDTQYIECFKTLYGDDIAEFEAKWDVEVELSDLVKDNPLSVHLSVSDMAKEDASTIMEEMALKIRSFDKRKYFKKALLMLYNNGDAYMGSYHMNLDTYKTDKEEREDYVVAYAQKTMGHSAELVRKSVLGIDDIPNLNEDKIQHTLGEDLDLNAIDVYTFEYEGKEYIVADVTMDNGKLFTNFEKS